MLSSSHKLRYSISRKETKYSEYYVFDFAPSRLHEKLNRERLNLIVSSAGNSDKSAPRRGVSQEIGKASAARRQYPGRSAYESRRNGGR